MSNSAAKVGDIFREAGTAFNKLSEMTLMLQPTEDSPTGKWSDEEVELLRGCVNRFAVELNKISSHIKNRTMSQLTHLLEMDSGKIHVVSNPPPLQQYPNFWQLHSEGQHPEVIVQLYQQGYQNHHPLQINNQQLYYQEQARQQLQNLEQQQYQNHLHNLEQQQQQQQLEQQRLQQQINLQQFDNNISINTEGLTKDFRSFKDLIRYFNPNEVSMKPPEHFMAGDEDDDFNEGTDSMNAMLGIPAIIQSLEQDSETSQGIGTLHAEMQVSPGYESALGGDYQQIRQNMVSVEEHFNMKQAQQTWYHASVGPADETKQNMVDANILYIPFYYENLHPISFIQVSNPAEVANRLPPDNVKVSAERPCKRKTETDPTPSTGAFSSIFKNKSQHQNFCLPPKETTRAFPISINPGNEKPDVKNVIFPSPFSLLNKYITSNDTCITEKKGEAPAEKVTKKSKKKNNAKPGPSSSKNSVCSTGKKKKTPAEKLTKTDEIQIRKNKYPRPLSWLDKYITKEPASSTDRNVRIPAINDTPPTSPGPFTNSLFNSISDLVNHNVVIEHANPLDMFETETFDNNFNRLFSNEQITSDDSKLSSNQPVVFEHASYVANERRTCEVQLLEHPVHQLVRSSADPTNTLVESMTEHTQDRTSTRGTQANEDLYETVPKKRYRKKEIVTGPGPVTRSQTRRMRTD